MSEIPRSSGNTQPHIAASMEYFAREFPEGSVGSSFGEALNTEIADFVLGVALSPDCKQAVVVADCYTKIPEEDPLICFPESFTPEAVFKTCLRSALVALYPDTCEELNDFDVDARGVVLRAELLEFDDSIEEQAWLDGVEEVVEPVPIDKMQPYYAYQFLPVGVGTLGEQPIAVGSVVFSTGYGVGNSKGFPPYWVYSSTISFEPDTEI